MQRQLLRILTSSLTARNVDQNFAILGRLLGTNEQTVGTLEVLARLTGGQAFEGAVEAANDTAFRHSLGRIPRMIVVSAPTGSATGPVVKGSTAWTSEFVYVRSGSDGDFAFVVT